MSRINDLNDQPGQQQSASGRGPTEELREKAHEVSQNLRDIGHTARSAAQEQVGHLRDSAKEYYEQGRHKAEDFEHNIETYVQEKPVQALLVAAGVGLVLGLLWRRS